MIGLLVVQIQSQDVQLIKNIFFDKDSWSLINEDISLDYDDKLNKLIHKRHSFPRLHSDGFCKPTLKHP